MPAATMIAHSGIGNAVSINATTKLKAITPLPCPVDLCEFIVLAPSSPTKGDMRNRLAPLWRER